MLKQPINNTKDYIAIYLGGGNANKSKISLIADSIEDAKNKLDYIVRDAGNWEIIERKTFEQLVEEYHVEFSGMWENELSQVNSPISEWHGVSNDDGIIAYFGESDDAILFREAKINRILESYKDI
jgi:hypothetical protein